MENNIIPTIKERIDKLMIAKGFKRYTLAERAGVSYPTIQNWYTSRNYHPSLDSLIKICEVLDISLSTLLLSEGEELYPINSEKKELLEYFEMLNTENKKLVISLIKNLTKD